jgi:glycosyltransferase involved in cell wall biosynthesis
MKENRDTILALTPVSRQYYASILGKLGLGDVGIDYYDLARLRRYSLKDLWITLRSIKSENIYLVFEESKAVSLIPIFGSIATLSNAKKIWILDNALNKSQYYRWTIFGSLFSLAKGTLLAHWNLFITYRKACRVLKTDRITVQFSDTKNLLYLKTNLWYGVQVGGSIGHISGVINAYAEKKYTVTYMSMEPPILLDESVRFESMSNIKYYGVPQEVNLYTFQQHVFNCFEKNKSFVNQKFYFIYSRMAIANYANVLISRRLKIPLILEYNGSEVWVSEKWGSGLHYKKAAQVSEDVCIKHAHLIVVVSDVLKKELMSRGVEENRILFYPNCIDPKQFNPNRFTESQISNLQKELNLSKDHKVLTFVGTFGQWHGADKFAEAIHELCNHHRPWLIENKVHFMLVGNGLKMEDVLKFVDNEICKPFVTLTGLIPQKDAPLYLAISDILMSPHVANSDGTNFFGSPTKLFEYMAMGKGIIASDLDQIGEVLKNSIYVDQLPQKPPTSDDTRMALLVKPGNVQDLIKAIKFLVVNNEWALSLGRNALQEAKTKYTWQIHVDEIMKQFAKNVSENSK